MAENPSTRGPWFRQLLRAANLAVYTAVGIAIVVSVNYFAGRYTRRWDLTPSKKFSLSPESLKLVKGLNRDVEIYSFGRESGSPRRRDLLDLYGVASRRVTVHYVDPDRQPTVARQFDVRRDGALVVVSGNKHFEAENTSDDRLEEAVTNALIRVLKGQKTACFLQGHGEHDPESTERTGYDGFKKQLQNENYQIKALVLLQKMEIASDCSVVVVAGPENDYLEQEVETIRKYVKSGGRGLFMLDPTADLPNLAKLLTDWNVTAHNDLVIDLNPMAQIFGTEPTMPLIIKYGSSPIVEPLARTATLFPITRSFAIGKESKTGVTLESLCETSPESYGIADFDPKVRQITVGFRAGKDFKGPLTVAVSGTLTGEGEKKSEGRFVALGTSNLAANRFLRFPGNRDLIMNMVNWLSAEEELISIRPKPPESQQLNLTAQQMNRIRYLGIFGVPLAIIAAGTMVWWRRR